LGAAGAAMLSERLGVAGLCEGELLLGRSPEGPGLGRPGEVGQRAEGGLGAASGAQSAGCEGQMWPGCAMGAGCEEVLRSGQLALSRSAVEDEGRAAVVGAG
jgi:hypothetical protein